MMDPKMKVRVAKAAAFVVASDAMDARGQRAIREWFDRVDGVEGQTYLLMMVTSLCSAHLQRVHGEGWAGALMETVGQWTENG